MRFLRLILIITLVAILIISGLIIYLSFFLDPNIIFSKIVEFAQETYYLKINYQFRGKNFISIIRGFEFENVEIYSNIKNRKKFLLSSQKVYLNFNLLSLLTSPQINSINISRSKGNMNNIIEYVNSDELKIVFSNSLASTSSNETKINKIEFDDLEIAFDNEKFNLPKLDIWLEKFEVEGFISETKSKFWFDGTNFNINEINAKKFLDNLLIMKVSGNIVSNHLIAYAGEISYSNIITARNVKISGDIEKAIFEIGVSNFIVGIGEKSISITNIPLKLNLKRGIEGEAKLLSNIKTSFIVNDKEAMINVYVSSLSKNLLPYEMVSYVSNFVKDFSVSGNIKINILANRLRLFGSLRGNIITLLENSLFENIGYLVEFNDDKANIRVNSKKGISSIELYSTIELEEKPRLLEIKLSSSKLNLKDLIIGSNDMENKESTKLESLPIIIDNVPLEVRVSSVVFGDNIPEIKDVSFQGSISFDKGKFYVPLEADSSIWDVKFVAKGNVEYSDKIRGELKFLPSFIDLKLLYPKLLSGTGKGNMYGKGVLKNIEVYIDNYITIKGEVIVSNVELIDVGIQNEITRVLNLNLNHIFIDTGNFHFVVETNVMNIVGYVDGDIISEFEFISLLEQNKSKLRFKYLKVDRSIVEDIPKVFFIRDEINGIKYKLDDRYLNFDKFEVELF